MEIFVVGPAGSGKSTFVSSFGEFLEDRGYEVCLCNLDPATDPAFEADVDIREFIRAEEVMKKFNLGINGALLKSIDLSLNFAGKLKCDADYVLYDTPGQMELFIYSASGREIVRSLSSSFSSGIFLMDASIVSEAESFLSAVMQNVIVSLRLSLPTLTAFNKCDLAEIDLNVLNNELKSKGGLLAELMEKVMFFTEYTTIPYRVLKISALKKIGFEDLFSAINELFCACGDIS
jgi:hypothetical protein